MLLDLINYSIGTNTFYYPNGWPLNYYYSQCAIKYNVILLGMRCVFIKYLIIV